jgi:tetratricopeptide (TPR) repeat protein
LRDRFAKNPKDSDAFGQLIGMLVPAKRIEEAHALYDEFVKVDPTPQKRAGYGAWLWRNGFPEDAERELRVALSAGYDSAHTRGYLGLALADLGKKEEAYKELDRALDGDRDQDIVRQKYIILGAELGKSEDQEKKPAQKAPSHSKGKKKKRKK